RGLHVGAEEAEHLVLVLARPVLARDDARVDGAQLQRHGVHDLAHPRLAGAQRVRRGQDRRLHRAALERGQDGSVFAQVDQVNLALLYARARQQRAQRVVAGAALAGDADSLADQIAHALNARLPEDSLRVDRQRHGDVSEVGAAGDRVYPGRAVHGDLYVAADERLDVDRLRQVHYLGVEPVLLEQTLVVSDPDGR